MSIDGGNYLMKTRLAAALAVAGLMAAGLVGLTPAAQATNHVHSALATEIQPEPVCATWKMRGATGAYPAVVWGGAPAGSSVTETRAKLVKPVEGVDPGVEFASFDLEVQAPADNEIHVSVKYELGDGAATVGTAIRMFGYVAQGANSVLDTPDYGPAIAQSETGGNLVFTIPAGKKLGTLGLVYDASNSAKGWVKFRQMKVGNRAVSFTTCPTPEPTQTATPTPTATATAHPTPGGTATPRPEPTGTPEPGLPVTGAGTTMMVLAGVCALGAGGLVTWLARRRRVKFTA
jgi:LPXTG-motif cell wall-anchored protein